MLTMPSFVPRPRFGFQDFTEAELRLMLGICQDPNGLFLTGDTAQVRAGPATPPSFLLARAEMPVR